MMKSHSMQILGRNLRDVKMAAVAEDAINLPQLIDRYFGSDSEDEGENFAGFDDADVEEAVRRARIVRTVDLNAPMNDFDRPADLENGWVTEDGDCPLIAPFTGNPGLRVALPDREPISFFNLLFEDDMWDLLVLETNRYADQKIEDGFLPRHSRMNHWSDVSRDEMKVFFALVIAMGLTEKSDIESYWSTEEILETPFFGRYMSRDRFLVILSNLHLNNKREEVQRGEDGHDPLAKVRPFIRMNYNTYPEVYYPNRDISVDEGTCPWKGRLRFKVYNPQKPNKFGIKLYQVCEAESGYCTHFDIYTGDKSESIAQYANAVGIDESYTTTTRIVIGLLARSGLLHRGHHVYMDNYYNSPELLEELDQLETYACGTLRKNRVGTPKAIKDTRLRTGQGISRRNNNVMVLKFHDKRDVHMISSIHTSHQYVLDRLDDNGEPVTKPLCIVDYIKKMGGVDLSDQIQQYYSVLRKTLKWWRKLFLHLLNLLITNAFVLFRKYGEKHLTQVQFRVQIVHSLIESAPDAPRPHKKGRKPLGMVCDRLVGRHFPSLIQPQPDARKQNPTKPCCACNRKDGSRKRKETR